MTCSLVLRCWLVVLLVLALGHQSSSELLSQCECGGTANCSCPIQPASRCRPYAQSVQSCKSDISGQCVDAHVKTRMLENCPAVGTVRNLKGHFTVKPKQEILRITWDEPAGADGAVGYIVNVHSPPDVENVCACVNVPPCVYRLNVDIRDLTLAGNNGLRQCLLQAVHAANPTFLQIQVISLPIEHDMNAALAAAPLVKIPVASCAERAARGDVLSDLCKAKLKYLLPNVSMAGLTVLEESSRTYLVSWKPLGVISPLPLEALVLSLPINQRDLFPDVNFHLFTGRTLTSLSRVLPPNATSYVIRFNKPFVLRRLNVTLRVVVNQLAAMKVLLNDSKLQATINDLWSPGDDGPHRRELTKQILDELTTIDQMNGRYTRTFNVTRNGGWSLWATFSSTSPTESCSGCNPSMRLTSRTCTNPAPSTFGRPCSGNATRLVRCFNPIQICQPLGNSVTNVVEESTPWYQQPVFYATSSTCIALLVFIVAMLYARHRRSRRKRLTARPVLGTSSLPGAMPPSGMTVCSGTDEKPDFIPPVVKRFTDRPLSPTSTSTVGSLESLLPSGDRENGDGNFPATPSGARPVVYISYSRRNWNHVQNVIEFSDWLAREGMDVILDQYYLDQFNSGMASWIEYGMTSATKIIAVQSDEYFNEWFLDASAEDNDDVDGFHEVSLESRLIKTQIMERENNCIPVFLGSYHGRGVLPKMLQDSRCYRVTEDNPQQAEALLNQIFASAEHTRPPFLSGRPDSQ